MYNQFKTLFLHKNKINSTLKNPGQKDKKRRSLEFNTCISKDRNHSRKPRINLNNAACTAIQQIHECWHKSSSSSRNMIRNSDYKMRGVLRNKV